MGSTGALLMKICSERCKVRTLRLLELAKK
jgi:hypothetical protein